MKEKLFHFLHRITPEFIIQSARRIKKSWRRKRLASLQEKGSAITQEDLENDLIRIGLRSGDVVLVHSSLSKIGYVENGAATVVRALQKIIGESGTLLMPAFPAPGRNLDYLVAHPAFDELTTPSRMGVITEYFRKLPGTVRSLHPTDSVCANGNDALWFVEGHFNQLTPYNAQSPFRRICERKGKILMLGTTLNGACTNLHTLEDAVDFQYPVYTDKIIDVIITDRYGKQSTVKTKVHNPEWSAKRNCDALKPLFIAEKVLTEGKIGEADSMLIDASLMLDVMIHNYYTEGVTMYTPYGGPVPQNL